MQTNLPQEKKFLLYTTFHVQLLINTNIKLKQKSIDWQISTHKLTRKKYKLHLILLNICITFMSFIHHFQKSMQKYP